MSKHHWQRREFLGSTAFGLAALSVAAQPPSRPECTADALNWPQFKGNAARSGDNLAAALTLPMQRIGAYRFPAPIYASPAVVGDHVFVQDALGNLACIDHRAGKVVWAVSLGGFNNVSSPAVHDGRVYVGSSTASLFILSARTGETIHRMAADGPVLASPAIANDAVYFSTLSGKLVKADLQGKTRWIFDGGRTSITEFAVRDQRIVFFAGSSDTLQYLLLDRGDRVETVQRRASSGQTCPTSGPAFLGESDYAYQCFDSEFGSFFLDDRILAVDVQDTRGVPSFRGSLLYRGDKCWELANLNRLQLKRHPQQNGTIPSVLWRADPQLLYDGGFHSSPALARDHLVIGAELGRVMFFNLEGTENVRTPAWTFAAASAGGANSAISSSPAVVDGRVLVGGEDAILYCLGGGAERPITDVAFPNAQRPQALPQLTGHDWPTPGGDMGFHFVAPPSTLRPPYRLRWQTRLWSTFKAPMIVAQQRVFCGGRSGLLAALDAQSGRILWKFHHPGVESRSAPTYADGSLFQLRVRCNQGDSPHVVGASGGPPGQGLWCHDAVTGEKRWHFAMPFAYQFNVDGLVVHQGNVFACETDAAGDLFLFAVQARDGKIAWRVKLDGLTPGRNRLVRFAAVLAQGVLCVAFKTWGVKPGAIPSATLGVDPNTGKQLWRRDNLGLDIRSRLGARRDLVVVFTTQASHALDPRTGREQWLGQAAGPRNSVTLGMQPLTDRFLDSKGQEGLLTVGGCHNPVLINDLVYSHDIRSSYSSNFMHALVDGRKIVWEHGFLSNACPTPSPAYERLYYAPNAEGVVYCFENEKR